MAWIAFVLEPVLHAPLVIFPLLIGVGLGGLLVLMLRALQVGHRTTLLCGGVIAVALAVVGQHYLGYRKARLDFEASLDKVPQMAVFFPEKCPPQGFPAFLVWRSEEGRLLLGHAVRGGWVWLSWGFDAILVLLPVMLLVGSAARLPFCRRCGSWFRTVRGGKLPMPAGRELAVLIDATISADARAIKFRMTACLGGCGPTGLAVFWEQNSGDYTSGTLWLDSDGRNRVTALLDTALAASLAESLAESAADAQADALAASEAGVPAAPDASTPADPSTESD